MARVQPICRLLSNAVTVVGPATTTRCSRCSRSTRPGRRITSACQAFGGQEHHREVRGVRWHDVLVADRFGLHAHRAPSWMPCRRTPSASPCSCVQQALVILARELESIGSHTGVRCCGPAGARHIATIRRTLTARVLLLGECLLEDVLQLHFAPAAVLDVGQHALEVAHAGGQLLRLAEATLHLFQALGDQRKELPSRVSSVDCSFSSTVWRICQLLGVVVLQRAQLFLQRGASRRCAARCAGSVPAGAGPDCRSGAAATARPPRPCVSSTRVWRSAPSWVSVRAVSSCSCWPNAWMRASCCWPKVSSWPRSSCSRCPINAAPRCWLSATSARALPASSPSASRSRSRRWSVRWTDRSARGRAIELFAQFAAPGAASSRTACSRRSCGGRRSRATSCRMSTANRSRQ